MNTRTETLDRARTQLDSEVFDRFNEHLPEHGPYTEEIISNAIWKAMGDVNKVHPVKMPQRKFISPIIVFEIDTSSPVFGW